MPVHYHRNRDAVFACNKACKRVSDDLTYTERCDALESGIARTAAYLGECADAPDPLPAEYLARFEDRLGAFRHALDALTLLALPYRGA